LIQQRSFGNNEVHAIEDELYCRADVSHWRYCNQSRSRRRIGGARDCCTRSA
jgi:hypothetical protein